MNKTSYKTKLINFWWWLVTLFQKRYTVVVSYDSEWGNADDQEWNHVRKIIKANFKELQFRTNDRRTIVLKGMGGLRYRIEEE